jgi:hypothetical protein
MAPISIEIEGYLFLNRVTLSPGEERVKLLGGNEGVRVRRYYADKGGEETYFVEQIDTQYPEDRDRLQSVILDRNQKSGHFYVGDTRIRGEYTEK